MGWKEAIDHRSDGDGPCGILPVCACPLRRQLHPIHRIVAVVVHDFRQAEVCDLDLTACRAVHEQDVACSGANQRTKQFFFKFNKEKKDMHNMHEDWSAV